MFKQFRKIKHGEFFVIGGDCSVGGIDRSCCQFLSKNNLDVPLVYCSDKIASVMTNEIHPVLERIYDVTGVKPLIAYERNNGGVFEMERLNSMNRKQKYEIFEMPNVGNVFNADSKKLGWDTNAATRPEMLKELKSAVDDRILKIYDEETLYELLSFVIVRTQSAWKAQAESNAHDDRVMALAITWQMFHFSPAIRDRKPDDDGRPRIEFRHRSSGY